MSENQHMVTISGIVAPAIWDEDFNIVAISLAAFNEKEYLIEDDAKGEELFDQLRNLVKITGIIKGEQGGDRIIEVKNYEVLNQFV